MPLSSIESILQTSGRTAAEVQHKNGAGFLQRSAVVLFRSFLQVWPLMSFVAVKERGREGGGGGKVEDPEPGGGGDDLSVQRHPAGAPAGDQYFNGGVKRPLYPLNILVFVHYCTRQGL